jgi:hypothetical protein
MSDTTNKAKTVTLWIVVGASALVSFGGVRSFGLFTMPLAMAGAIVLAARLDRMRGWAVMLCAIAVAPAFMAWFNRDGPGRICRNVPPYGVGCSDQLNPWPLLAGAVVTLVVAAVLFVHASRRDAARPGHGTPSA